MMMGLLWGLMAATQRPIAAESRRPARLLGRAPRGDFSARRPTIIGTA
jgi:hypothetical protein